MYFTVVRIELAGFSNGGVETLGSASTVVQHFQNCDSRFQIN
jgi:hypothetical protein